MAIRRLSAGWVAGTALLLAALLGGVFWQWQGQRQQFVDVGGVLDEVSAIDFHAPERGDTTLSYRWSNPAARLRLGAPAPGTLAQVGLRMFAPPQPSGPQRVALSVNGTPIGEVAVVAQPRVYHFMLAAPAGAPLEIGLASPPLVVAGDSRALGVAVDSITLTAIGPARPADLVRQLWAAPYLPAGLLLLAAAALLLRLPPLSAGAAPLLALLALALADRALRDVRLLLAFYLFVAAAVGAAALAFAALLRRAPSLLPTSDRRARVWIVAAFGLTLAATFVPTVRSDGIEYYAYLRSPMVDGDLDFANEYHETPFPQISDKFRPTITGHYENLAAIGPAIVWSPLYTAGHLIVLAGRQLGMPWQADGYAPPYVVLTVFTSALAGLAIMLVGYRIVRRWVSPPVAALAVITTLLGSNLLYYSMREGSFAHAASGAAATLYVLAWLRLEEQPSVWRWALMGAAAGATALMYWIGALVLVLPVCTFARLLLAALRAPERHGNQIGRLLLGAAAAAALLLLVFSPQLIAWKIIYGSFLAIPHGNEYIRPRGFQGFKLLFSHLYGLLPWTPAFFVGLAGLPLLWRRSRWLMLCLLVGFLAYFGYNASLARWFGGGSFGLRRMTVLTPWFMIGLALLFAALARWRAIAPAALAALMVAWATLLLVRYDLFLIAHVPEEIAALPAQRFYLSRDTLPFWGLRGWLNNTYLTQQLRAAGTPASLATFLALVAVMVLSTWLVVWLYGRLTDARPDGRARDANAA